MLLVVDTKIFKSCNLQLLTFLSTLDPELCRKIKIKPEFSNRRDVSNDRDLFPLQNMKKFLCYFGLCSMLFSNGLNFSY